MHSDQRGEIITFYSYKGGTGRSMALANVACLLAARPECQGEGVLMIDWDLEAPGCIGIFIINLPSVSQRTMT
jgi:MinD-like ATPase involved in chromosome partitioning or flagellar assembly